MNYIKALKWMYSPITELKKKYPKAAKKKRIIKKWISRYGNDVDMRNLVYRTNPFLAMLPKNKSFPGMCFSIARIFGKEYE